MPLPLAPVLSLAVRYGAVAFIGAAIAKRVVQTKSQKNPHREAVMDTVPEGLQAERIEGEDEVQVEASHGAWRRIWIGHRGFEIDTRVLGRLRVRRLSEEDQK